MCDTIKEINELMSRVDTLKAKEINLNIEHGVETESFIYDPDSSLRAWEYYFKKYDIDLSDGEKDFREYFFEENFKKARGFVKTGKINAKRIIGVFAIEIANNDYKFILKRQSKNALNYIRIGGDCAFNFNKEKIGFFRDIIIAEPFKAETNDFLSLLDRCHQTMHHSVFNFTLMPTTGALNNFKGISTKCDSKKYDRLDKFVFHLKDFFEKPYLKHDALSLGREENKKTLFSFLEKDVQSFENYCNLFYHINSKETKDSEGKNLYDKLLENGKKEINNSDSLLQYIKLAVDFWEHQSNHYDKCIEELSTKGDE